MATVYILRHPQTTWNVAERYQGRLESGLSTHGKKQIRLTADAFRYRPIDAVFSSPLQRALNLARAIADVTQTPLNVDQRLTEIAMGPWEGLYRDEIESRFPELFKEWYARPDLVRFPGGEDLKDVRVRSNSALDDIMRTHADQQVCVVTHSSVVQAMAAGALRLDPKFIHRLHVDNASITALHGNRAPGSLISYNVTEHLLGTHGEAASTERAGFGDEERLAS